MLCSLKELSLTAEHDYPYAVITPAALLNDYHPLDPTKPSIPADIQPGDKVFGPVAAAKVLERARCRATARSIPVSTSAAPPPLPTPPAPISTRAIWWPTTPRPIPSARLPTCTPSSASSRTASPTASSSCVRIVKPGDDVAKVIGYDDSVVEFEITPNRPDCLSVIGLAREAAAHARAPQAAHPEVKGCGGSIAELVDIEIEDGELCPRYTARMVKNVKIAPSPQWMRERLRNAGMRPINNIVDITNYVMLEYGQPMHAFDFSCVDGGRIVVRAAREGEVIQTLDGNDRKLTPNMLCICDEHKPVVRRGRHGR